MPRVPSATTAGLGQVEARPLSAPALPMRASPVSFGGIQARQLAGLAEITGQAGDVLGQHALRLQAQTDANRVREAETLFGDRRLVLLNDPEAGLYGRRGKATVGVTKLGLDGLAAIEEDIVKGLDNDLQRQLFRQRIAGDKDRAADALSRLEAIEMRTWRQDTATAVVANATSDAIANHTDSAQVTAKLADIESQLRANVGGAPPEEVERQVRAARSAVHLGVASRLLDGAGGPDAAQRWLTGHEGEIEGSVQAQLDAAIAAERKRRDAEARARQREAEADARARRMELQFTARLNYADELAAASRGETAHPNVEQQILRAYEAGDAGPMIERLQLVREEGSLARSLAAMPAADIAAALAGRAPEGAGYGDEAESQERLAAAAEKIMARRAADPAAEAARAFPEIAAGLGSDDPAAIAAATRRSIEVQRDVFGMPADRVQPMTRQAASRAVELWQAAEATDRKLDLLASLVRLPGADGQPDDGLARAVLDQLEAEGLPEGADMAIEAVRSGDIGRARSLVSALAIDPKDLPKLGDATAQEVGRAIDGLATASTGSAVSAHAALLSGQAETARGFARERNLVDRLTRQHVAAGVDPEEAAAKADRTVYGAGPVLADEGLAMVRLPAGADPLVVADGLTTLRAGLDLGHLAPPESAFAAELARDQGPAAGMRVQAMRLHDAWVQRIRGEGVWINRGTGFALVGPSGQLVPGPDGQVRIWTMAEVEAAAAVRPGAAAKPLRGGIFGP